MSDFMDSEAEESGEELEETKEKDEAGSDEEEEEDIDENEINDIIDDNPIEEEEEDDDDDDVPSRKRKLESDDDDIDDDDLELIKENTGINIKKKKHSRVKLLDSDDDEEEEEDERDQIAHDIFDQEEGEGDQADNQSVHSVRSVSRQSTQYAPVENIGEESEDEGEEIDNFIVDDDDKPIAKQKKKKSRGGVYTDSALQEAQDIFGLEFDLSEFDQDALDEEVDYDDEEIDEEEAAAIAQRKKKRKGPKKSIYQIYEPTELEKSHLTIEDGKIKVTDIPERFQLRAVPIKPASDIELDEEAEWIYKQAFMIPPISQQNFQDPIDPSKQYMGFEAKPVTAIPRIRAALSFMKKDLFEVPFIAMYRKEYVEPEMKKDDLWKVYEWDEKWTTLKNRKENMKQLFEHMQQYQFHKTQQNPDAVDILRLLDQDDIDRLDNAQNNEELMDVYAHFQLYYGNDLPDMQEWKETQQAEKPKRTKKKTIRVKKVKDKSKSKKTVHFVAEKDNAENNKTEKEKTESENLEKNITEKPITDDTIKKAEGDQEGIKENAEKAPSDLKSTDDSDTIKADNNSGEETNVTKDSPRDLKAAESSGEGEQEKGDIETTSNSKEDKLKDDDEKDIDETEINKNEYKEEEDKEKGDKETETNEKEKEKLDIEKEGEEKTDTAELGEKENTTKENIEQENKDKENSEKETVEKETTEKGDDIETNKEKTTANDLNEKSNTESGDIDMEIDDDLTIKENEAIDPETGEKITKSPKQNGQVNIIDDEDEESESEYEEQEIEVTDSEMEEEPDVVGLKEKKRKLPRRRDLYVICKDNGLVPFAAAFGLTAEQFAENLRDNYQRNEPEQHQQEPLELAKDFICNTFPSPEAVTSGACHMVAVQIAREPLVKQTVRQVFYERAKINIVPTRKGKKDIDHFHAAAPFKYLKSKPVRDLHGEQFFKMWQAEQDQLVKIRIYMEDDPHRASFLDELKSLFNKDEFSHLVQEWNKLREKSLSIALTNVLYPMLAKELKFKLLMESRDFAIQTCAMKLRSWVSTAPYQPDSNEDNEFTNENESNHCCRVMACSFSTDRNEASFFIMLDTDGQVVDFLRLKYLLLRYNSRKESERKNKEKDMDRLKDFIQRQQPRVIAISAECRDAVQVYEDVNRVVKELEEEHQMSHIYVEFVDGEIARIYQDSPRAITEFREYPDLLRHAVSIGRRIQEPLLEFAGLCDSEDELLCLRFHPLQEYLPQDLLKHRLHVEFINIVNEVGVDINRALDFPHAAVVTQFLCGLGPRKGGHLLKFLRQLSLRLENRSQLVTVCEMGLQVFLNCAGFIRIEPSDANDKYEVLDGTRIHPETYDWPRKMAVDALEYDDVPEDSNPSSAVEEILDQPERLKDLDLDAFAEELARQGYGNKQITLYDIRDELINRFKDHRIQYKGLSFEERFRLLTGETPQTMYYGRMITCKVVGFAYKKPTKEQLDSANPTRNDETNLWKCPFCLKDAFTDLSEVWTHFDNGSCPGQAVGVRTRLDNGISGFISSKNISDKGCRRPEERVRTGMTLHARVFKINYERMQLDLTCKTSDLADIHGRFAPPKDLYYDQENHDKDKKQEDHMKAAIAKRTTYLKRVISHPSFKNVTFKDAEKLLETMEQGDCIVRPSSKGSDHLTVTWKVHKSIYQHIDVREEGKENAFSIGKSLWIDNEEYEDLDEILARHISPMANHAREVIAHKYYKDAEGGIRAKLEEVLIHEKQRAPRRIPYFFSCSKQIPGKFMLGYMPRNKPRIEFVSITPDGFRYRGRIHANTNNLLKWFKEHFRDPVPGVGTPASMRRTPFGGGTPMSVVSGFSGSGINTPYTPGGTPSNLITDEEAAKLIRNVPYNTPGQYSTPGGLSTPGQYSTPGHYSTPGSLNTPGSITTPGSINTPSILGTPGSMSTPGGDGGQTPTSSIFDETFNQQWNELNRTPQSSFGNRTPQSSFGNRTPQSNFGGRTPQSNFGNRTPQNSFGNRTPQSNFGGNRTPQSNFGGNRTPQMNNNRKNDQRRQKK